MTAYSQGQAVEVWSNSKQAWLAAEVIKHFASSAVLQGESISAGTVQVRSTAGVKCVAQEDIPRLLRAAHKSPESVLSFRWEVCTNTGWQAYSHEDAALLNEAVSKGYERVQIENHGNTYEVDMKDLVQVNIKTGNSRLVRKLGPQTSDGVEAAGSPTASTTGTCSGISLTGASLTAQTKSAIDSSHTLQLPGLMYVSVPSTVRPGERISITTPQGEQRTVVVPDGVGAGYWLRFKR
eukprot:TRINITY_DN104881_c0_g1_i1.p1 TRINITY_DN104881_c0_g1~~TRINITY_DN104881_c0_g1_i1.p1  ORF type:complete len:237 (-),score=26.49 TRINITY_DN104881_c0_g1_i1:246-956(-)